MDLTTPEGRREQGQRLQRAIIEAGYDSLTAFAEELGCSRALIYQYVNGAVLAQPDRVQAISRLTGRPLEWFFADDPEALTDAADQLQEKVEQLQQQVTALQGDLAGALERAKQQMDRHQAELLEFAGSLAAVQRQAGDARSLLEAAQRWRELAASADDSAQESAAWASIGHAWREMGEMAQARDALEHALDAADRAEDEEASLGARQELVAVLQGMGETAEARRHAQAVAEHDSWWARWAGLVARAAISEQTGDYDQAEQELAEAETVLGDQDADSAYAQAARAYAAGNRINVLIGRGRYREALALADEMTAAAERSRLRDQMMEAWLNVGHVCFNLGQMRRAREVLSRAREWAEATEDRARRVLSTSFLAEWLAASVEGAEAKQLARDALAQAEEGRLGFVQVYALLALGAAHLEEEEASDAAYYLQRACRAAEDVQARKLAAVARARLALALAQTDAGQAREAAEAALSAAREMGARDAEAEAGAGLAWAHLAAGASEAAQSAAQAAHDLASELGLLHHQRRALTALARAHADRQEWDAAEAAGASTAELTDRLRGVNGDTRDALSSADAAAYSEWAFALEQLDRREEAEAAWAKIPDEGQRERLRETRGTSDTA